MKKVIFLKKFLSIFLIISLFSNFITLPVNAVSTNGTANPWTIEKAEHLAKRALIGPNPDIIQTLYNAGSAQAAVNILFPSVPGPDRTAYLAALDTFKGVSFNPSDTNQNRQVYAFNYYADPYEAKRKLFGLFEDIFSVDRTGGGVADINFPDVDNHFKVLYEESLGNYKKMVKRVLFDSANPENSFAMGKYLDLLNQPDKNYPNENYARELMQLFLMLEYKPWEDAETPGAVRNYSEADVAALAKIITGFRAGDDKKVYFDNTYHNTSTGIIFLSGALKSGDNFSFYNSASGSIDNTQIINPISGNNGLGDNIIDYIFSKREAEIADFLSWRLLRYYTTGKPTQTEIETLANQIISNNFDLYPTIKWLLSSDMMYSDKSMNSVWYKNPIELTIGTLKLLHYKESGIVIDPLLKDTSLLTNLDFIPYNPRSIFGRDGFDNNAVFMNAYFHNQWVTYTSKIAFTTGTGYYNLGDILPITRLTNSGTISVKTNTGNTYSGSINLSNITISLNENLFQNDPAIQGNISSFGTSGNDGQLEGSGTGSEDIIPLDNQEQSGTGETQSGSLDETNSSTTSTGSTQDTQTNSGETTVDNGQTDTGTFETGTGGVSYIDKLFSYVIPSVNAGVISANTINFATGVVVFPDFYIQTSSGKVNLEGTFNSSNGQLTVSSGSFLYGTGSYSIANMTFNVDSGYSLERDITIDETILEFEKYFYFGKTLPDSVKTEIKNYLLKDSLGADRMYLPNNTNYRNKYLKSLISFFLSQPEFLLKSGYDLAQITDSIGSTPINDSSKKLVMIELYGGYDWMNGVIPKTDSTYYENIRGELAMTGSNVIDLGSVYLNKNLEGLKPFFDSGELRIVNRVGAPNHSRGHDTAAIQVASQKALQTVGTPGLIGELIKNDTNPLNNVVLGTNRPPIYTNGRYINIGGNSILYKNNISGPSTAEKTQQLNSLKAMLNFRNYPSDTKSTFINSITLDNVGNSGQSSVGYTLSGRLNFTKNLMDNGLGITYYVPGGGGYDTHGDQLKSGAYNLNSRTKDLVSDITAFFNNVKASGKDVTIVVYSEFGRTLKANGTIGTDHGQGGGYFILTTNNALKTAIPDKVVGKISPEKEYNDWFGIGVDYRSIYSKILSSLYNIDVNSYFFGEYKLEDDLNTTLPTPVNFRTEVRHYSNNYMTVDFKFSVDDKNFLTKDGSYINFYYGQDPNNLSQYSKYTISNYALQKDGSFKLNLNLQKLKTYYYKIVLVDNQYDTYTASGSFVVPDKYESNSTNSTIPLNVDSLFAKYNNTSVSGSTNITKLVLYDNPIQIITSTGTTSTGSTSTGSTSTGTISYSGSLKDVSFTGGIVMTFGTGETSISTLTHSGTWNGGFIVPKFINISEFLSDSATFSGTKLKNLNIEKILKVGADTMGVGMQLNQNVKFKIPVSQSGSYKVITSEDGINWTEISGATNDGSNVNFETSHFSYFAVYKEVVQNNNNNNNGNTGSGGDNGNNGGSGSTGGSSSNNNSSSSSSGGGGGGSGGGLVRDYCPTGDNSPSYYDRTCGNVVKKTTQVVKKDREYIQNLKKKLLAERLKNKLKQKEVSQKTSTTKYNGYEIVEISGYSLSDSMKNLSVSVINSSKISKADKANYVKRFNEYLLSRYNLETTSTKNQELKNKYNKQFILLRGVMKKLQK